MTASPNPRLQRTRLRSPLSRKTFGDCCHRMVVMGWLSRVITVTAIVSFPRSEAVQASTITVVPATPTSADYISVLVHGGDENCDPPSRNLGVAVTGSEILVTLERCGVAPAAPCSWDRWASIGRLQEGRYHITVQNHYYCVPGTDFFGEKLFDVQAGIVVPTLSPLALGALAVLLALTAVIMLRR